MSPAELLADRPTDRAPARPRARLVSTRFLRSELAMIFRRRRNQAILGVLAGIPILIAVSVYISDHHGGRGGHDSGALFGSITDNGVFVAFAAIFVVLTVFLPMAVSVVAGESIAGEANTGTLRYLLTVPVNRTRLLAVKYAGILAWCVAAPLVVAIFGVASGLVFFPAGNVTLLSGTQISFEAGLFRLLLVVLYAAAMMAAVGAIGLFVSTLTEVPIAAMATTLALSITSAVLDAIPQLSAIHPWLFSHYWLQFADLIRDPLEFSGLEKGLAVSAAYVAIFLSLAWARIGSKDISS